MESTTSTTPAAEVGGITVFTKPRHMPVGLLREGDQIRPVKGHSHDVTALDLPEGMAEAMPGLAGILAIGLKPGRETPWHTVTRLDVEVGWPDGDARITVTAVAPDCMSCDAAEAAGERHQVAQNVGASAIVECRERVWIDPWETDVWAAEATATETPAAHAVKVSEGGEVYPIVDKATNAA